LFGSDEMGRKKKISRADIDKYQLAEEKQQITDMINHKCYHCSWARRVDRLHVSCFWRRCETAAGINTKPNTPVPVRSDYAK